MNIELNFWKRQSGKTRYIVLKAKKGDAIVCSNINEMRLLLTNRFISSNVKVVSVRNANILEKFVGRSFQNNTIWLDEFDSWGIDDQNRVLHILNKIQFKKAIGISSPVCSVKVRKDLGKSYWQLALKKNLQVDLKFFLDKIISPYVSDLFLNATKINVKKDAFENLNL